MNQSLCSESQLKKCKSHSMGSGNSETLMGIVYAALSLTTNHTRFGALSFNYS